MENLQVVVMPIENTNIAVWLRRMRIASGVALFQISTQFVNALTGFTLVRVLDKNEYALFTIAGSMLALMATLSDLGAQTGLLFVGGKVHQDRDRLSQLVATAILVRFIIAGFALLIVGPMSWYFLTRISASWAMVTSLTLMVFAGTIPSTFASVLVVPLRLVGKYHATQLADLVGAVCRLLGSLIAILIAPLAALCTFATLLAQSVQCLVLRGSARNVLNLAAAPSIEDRRALINGVRALWFPTAFDALQSQIAIWILGLLGTASDVADLGALNRFGALYSVVATLIGVPISAAFARCQYRSQLVHLLFQSAAGLGGFCGMLILLAFVFPAPFVWVLGSSYNHLSNEIGLYFIYSSIGAFTMLVWEFARSKMWVTYIWTIPPTTVLVQCLLFLFLDVTTISGALKFMIGSSLVTLIIAGLMALQGVRNMTNSH
jgi:O-antigen/teichoic acid export membrane protein